MYNLGNLLCRTDDTVAVIFEREYTYRELDQLAKEFAVGLSNNGVKKGTRVAIMADNSPWFISAYLGILRLGAVAVLISTRLPQELIYYIIKDSDSVIVLTDRNFDDYLAKGEVGTVNVDSSDPAFMLYTSGSTSKPKGVIIAHNHLWTIQQKSKNKLLPKVRMLVAAPCYHMNGLSNVEVALAGGATVILMPKFNASRAIDLIVKNSVNYISSVPTMISLLLKELGNQDLSCVKHIAMASAPVSLNLYRSIKERIPSASVSIAYGSTEAGPGLFGRHPTLPTPEMSVGYPAQGIDYRLVEGVLQIKSPSMMLKYNNKPSNFTEDGYFITNDLFRVDEQGFYYFVGRADDMFVSGGDNVYPRQVESVLEEHTVVKDSAVIGLEDEVKGMKPYAFVTVTDNVSVEALKEHCLSKLLPAACPRDIWIVDSMPLTGVQKIDKAKLKEQAYEYIKQ